MKPLDLGLLRSSGTLKCVWTDTSLRARLYRAVVALGRICADQWLRFNLWRITRK